ncbi:DoxX family protein [Spiractinospora alimapuensis]|uniref:DoxX family protein n=1 Tax=Spiractinospora alimapuensis TaxID=2820884 RepID=UPI001F1E391C|nr:DoxX family protein [Spiractinospora alimapuensis]QVQ52732.1 DoxX family protein [Spiractinospora alimapuensis]
MPARNASDYMPQGPGRALNVILWILQILLAVFFAVASAFPKLTGHESARVTFDAIGYGDWFMYLIGVLELAGAIALVIPILSGVAALALAGLMVGAFIYEVTVIQSGFWYTPVILFALFVFVAWGRRYKTVLLMRRVGLV